MTWCDSPPASKSRKAGALNGSLHQARDTMLDGYRSTIKMGGSPIALAEEEHILQSLGIAELKSPEHFWRNLNRLPPSRRRCPALARQARSRSFSESNQWLVNP
jgi:hypothetical protein